MPDLSTPNKARDHARAMAGTLIQNMPTIPATVAKQVPPGVDPGALIWDETLGGGEYAARVLKRGSRVRLENIDGDGCIQLLVLNADRPIERIN